MAGNVILKLEDLKIGIKLPAPIFDSKKKSLLLLNQGVILTQQFVEKLRERGISSVSVDEKFADEVRGFGKSEAPVAKKIETPVLQQKVKKQIVDPHKKLIECKPVKEIKPTKAKAAAFKLKHKANQQVMGSVYDLVQKVANFSKDQIQGVTLSSIEQMAEDIDLFVQQALTSHETAEDHTHALRVAELSIATAYTMKIPEEQIQFLGLGCLLSRSGITEETRELMKSNKKLNVVEMIEVKKNPSRTFDIMAKCPELHMITRQVAYQIFERWDGSGYPRGRIGVQIHPLARLAGLCDVYVAMTTDRPHRKGLSGYGAVQEIIKETKKGKFDPAVVRGLLQTISLFPLGTYLKLSNGHIGKVIRSTPEIYDRPILILISTPEHEVFELTKNPDVQILEVIEDENELAMLIADFFNQENETFETVEQDVSASPDEEFADFQNDTATVWEDEALHPEHKSKEHQLKFNFF